ncbi:hypothetical protein MJO28_008800 [Puccinia striiformis f. sp. tritici]|uniref:Uncharacterized protein n=1 Tax=Puccinia striiformis f. sp. tritici TaxID=168172 RepID=A0ACC0ECF0_9BASI|nr:hypothetical protein MJO28_008800 [Puccinia striiformis f. sp. tritici]
MLTKSLILLLLLQVFHQSSAIPNEVVGLARNLNEKESSVVVNGSCVPSLKKRSFQGGFARTLKKIRSSKPGRKSKSVELKGSESVAGGPEDVSAVADGGRDLKSEDAQSQLERYRQERAEAYRKQQLQSEPEDPQSPPPPHPEPHSGPLPLPETDDLVGEPGSGGGRGANQETLGSHPPVPVEGPPSSSHMMPEDNSLVRPPLACHPPDRLLEGFDTHEEFVAAQASALGIFAQLRDTAVPDPTSHASVGTHPAVEPFKGHVGNFHPQAQGAFPPYQLPDPNSEEEYRVLLASQASALETYSQGRETRTHGYTTVDPFERHVGNPYPHARGGFPVNQHAENPGYYQAARPAQVSTLENYSQIGGGRVHAPHSKPATPWILWFVLVHFLVLRWGKGYLG